MKIACIGNMNNMMFPICVYLLENGHDVSLYYLEEYDHFKPDPSLVPATLNIIDLGWNEAMFKHVSKHEIVELFDSFDFFIGTDYAAAYLSKAKIKLDIYMPAGSDLFHWPWKKFDKNPPETWEINKVRCARHQLFGIRHARYISLDYTHPLLEQYLVKLGNKSSRIPVLPFMYFGKEGLLKLRSNKKDIHIEEKCLNVFQHSRQAWQYDADNLHHKGNDKLIRGFAAFVKSNEVQSKLFLLEYGEHVAGSKKLIDELEISSMVKWIPKMHKDELLMVLEQMDICVGNLQRSFVSYGSVYEALACKVAFMGNRKDELYQDQFSELYPMIHACSTDEVTQQLMHFYNHKTVLKEMGEQAHVWLQENAIRPSVNAVLEVIDGSKGKQQLPSDWKLKGMQPYFYWIRIVNFFKIRLGKA